MSSAPVVDEVSSSTVETLNSPLNRNAASCHRLIQTNQQILLFSLHLANSRWCFTDLIFHDDWLHHKFQFLLLEPQTRSLLVPSSWGQWKRRMSALAETLLIITLKYTHLYKYNNSEIHKYTNLQIHKYTNLQIHKYTNAQVNK